MTVDPVKYLRIIVDSRLSPRRIRRAHKLLARGRHPETADFVQSAIAAVVLAPRMQRRHVDSLRGMSLDEALRTAAKRRDAAGGRARAMAAVLWALDHDGPFVGPPAWQDPIAYIRPRSESFNPQSRAGRAVANAFAEFQLQVVIASAYDRIISGLEHPPLTARQPKLHDRIRHDARRRYVSALVDAASRPSYVPGFVGAPVGGMPSSAFARHIHDPKAARRKVGKAWKALLHSDSGIDIDGRLRLSDIQTAINLAEPSDRIKRSARRQVLGLDRGSKRNVAERRMQELVRDSAAVVACLMELSGREFPHDASDLFSHHLATRLAPTDEQVNGDEPTAAAVDKLKAQLVESLELAKAFGDVCVEFGGLDSPDAILPSDRSPVSSIC